MTKVAIVGITADPPTKGHALLALQAYSSRHESEWEYNEVWMMPCNIHKYGKKTAKSFHRLAMTSLVVAHLNRIYGDTFKVCDIEIEHDLNGSAWDTLQKLKEFHPTDEFHWVIGMDNAEGIDQWHNAEQLKKTLPFRVVQRGGIESETEDAWYTKYPHKLLESQTTLECASSEFKRLYRDCDPTARDHVYPTVYDYIEALDLYQEQP